MNLPLYHHSPLTRAMARALLIVALDRYERAAERMAKIDRAVSRLMERNVKLPSHKLRELGEGVRQIKRALAAADVDLERSIDWFVAAHVRVSELYPLET